MKSEKLKTVSARSSSVKIIGRTIYEDSTLWLIHSASGIEFDLEAKSLYFNLVGDETAHPSSRQGKAEMNWARYQIFIDGKPMPASSMDSPEKSVCAFDGEEKRRVRVQLLKLTEGCQSFMGIRDIQLDEEAVIKPAPDKKLLIEFIGDSITCGYGVEGKSAEEPFTTQTENSNGHKLQLKPGIKIQGLPLYIRFNNDFYPAESILSDIWKQRDFCNKDYLTIYYKPDLDGWAFEDILYGDTVTEDLKKKLEKLKK